MSQPAASQQSKETYSPQEHLVTVKTCNGLKEHYPFNWRLHEFRLRYPAGILDANVIQMDVERDLVIVKVVAKEDDLGACTGVGLQAGSLTLIDQVVERAKVQALADLGIGCAWPVVFDATPDVLVVDQDEPVEKMAESSTALRDALPQSSLSGNETASNTHGLQHHLPTRTLETVQAFYAKTYGIPARELEAKFAKFVLGITGRPLSRGPLTEGELNKINGVVTQAWQRKKTDSGSSVSRSGTATL